MNPIESKMESSESKMNPIESNLDSNKSQKYNCYFCNKSYSTNSNLNKHLKKCQEKDNDLQFKKDMLELVNKLNSQLSEQRDQLTKQQEEFKKQLEKRDQQIDILIKKTGMNISNSTITQNIQQNINYVDQEIPNRNPNAVTKMQYESPMQDGYPATQIRIHTRTSNNQYRIR